MSKRALRLLAEALVARVSRVVGAPAEVVVERTSRHWLLG